MLIVLLQRYYLQNENKSTSEIITSTIKQVLISFGLTDSKFYLVQ